MLVQKSVDVRKPNYFSTSVEQCRTESTQLGQRVGRRLRVALSQKHPLQAVSGHAALILRLGVALRVGAARRGALRGAQVVHERQPILSTEVHKFDLANTRIKVDSCGGEEHVAAQGLFSLQTSITVFDTLHEIIIRNSDGRYDYMCRKKMVKGRTSCLVSPLGRLRPPQGVSRQNQGNALKNILLRCVFKKNKKINISHFTEGKKKHFTGTLGVGALAGQV